MFVVRAPHVPDASVGPRARRRIAEMQRCLPGDRGMPGLSGGQSMGRAEARRHPACLKAFPRFGKLIRQKVVQQPETFRES